jgi:hypothetical protein
VAKKRVDVTKLSAEEAANRQRVLEAARRRAAAYRQRLKDKQDTGGRPDIVGDGQIVDPAAITDHVQQLMNPGREHADRFFKRASLPRPYPPPTGDAEKLRAARVAFGLPPERTVTSTGLYRQPDGTISLDRPATDDIDGIRNIEREIADSFRQAVYPPASGPRPPTPPGYEAVQDLGGNWHAIPGVPDIGAGSNGAPPSLADAVSKAPAAADGQAIHQAFLDAMARDPSLPRPYPPPIGVFDDLQGGTAVHHALHADGSLTTSYRMPDGSTKFVKTNQHPQATAPGQLHVDGIPVKPLNFGGLMFPSFDDNQALGGGLYVGPDLVAASGLALGQRAYLNSDGRIYSDITAAARPVVATEVRDALVDKLPAEVAKEAGMDDAATLALAAQALAAKLSTMSPGQQAIYLFEEELERKRAGQLAYQDTYPSDFPLWVSWRGGKVGVEYARGSSAGEDNFLKALYAMQGYDALPTLVSEKQLNLILKYEAGRELFRGVNSDSREAAARFLGEFQSGEYYAGRGVNGPGTYCGSRSDASSYNGRSVNGAIVRMALSRKARVIAAAACAQERSALETELENRLNLKMRQRLRDESDPARQRFVRRLYNDRLQAVADVCSTDSYYCVWKGYEALSNCKYSTTTYLVYNRAMLYVQKELI